MKEEHKIRLTPRQALLKAAGFCAYQERSHKEVIERLGEWGIWGIDAQEILFKLIEQNYVNEERFAIAYAGGKFRVKHWGKVKIKQGLKQHDVSDYCIKKALNEIDDNDYFNTLEDQISKKWAETKDIHVFAKKSKIARHLIARGFESELVWDELKKRG